MPVVNAFAAAFLQVTDAILSLYMWIIFFSAALSWLISFGIVNPRSQFVQAVGEITLRITEPLLGPIRRMLPPMRGLDLSPIVLYFIIYFIRLFIRNLSI